MGILKPHIQVNQALIARIKALQFSPAFTQAQGQAAYNLHREVFEYDPKLSAGCANCIMQMYIELNALTKPKNNKIMAEQTKKYQFKPEFGSYREFGSGIMWSNANLTDEAAEALIQRNPSLLQHMIVKEDVKQEAVKATPEIQKKKVSTPIKTKRKK